MTQLVQIRQRIQAIETIEKMSHAMRLIAMANHNSLRSKQHNLESFHQDLTSLFSLVVSEDRSWMPSFAKGGKRRKTLLILIGSDKGLCGTFNTMLFRYFRNHYETNNEELYDFIIVGKKAIEFAQKKDISPVFTIDNITTKTLQEKSEELSKYIFSHLHQFKSLYVFRNINKSFFSQVPEKTEIFPIQSHHADEQSLSDYIWEEPKEIVLENLCKQVIQNSIYVALFQSLYAEQAARFQSMDNATRNAKDLLEVTQRMYNKLRQAKITKELSELSANFSQ